MSEPRHTLPSWLPVQDYDRCLQGDNFLWSLILPGFEQPIAVFGIMFVDEIVKDLTLFFVDHFRQSFVE
jgi:hypothetical protein